MTEEIIIDVSNCPHKSDDDCMEVPICNEYGDLMGYQSCEAQTLCPYRSQKKIERLEQERNDLQDRLLTLADTYQEARDTCKRLEQENKELKEKAPMKLIAKNNKYRSELEEIREILKFYADSWVDEKKYPNLHYDNTKAKEGLSIINEVLNDK